MQIIFLSNQLFDYPLKTNKWHVATRMAALGHNVLFVDPPIRFRKFLKQIFQGRWPLRRILTFIHRPRRNMSSQKGSTIGEKSSSRNFITRGDFYKNLTVYTPVGLIPFSGGIFGLPTSWTIVQRFGKRLRLLNQRFHIRRIKKLLDLSPKPYPLNPVLWIYHIEVGGLEKYIEEIPHDFLIYDCVDNYPAFPRYRRDPELKNWIVKREEWLAKKADLVFTTAPGLQEKLSKLNKNTFYVGNAGDYNRFAEIRNPKSEIRNKFKIPNSKPIIGFTGAVDGYKVNLPLLVKIAQAYPNYSLILIGPTGVADDEPNLKELKSLPNVQILGEKPYEEMPKYFSQFDVYIIPYNLNEYTVGGCFPVKFFDALAAGLPTIVTNLPCYRDFSDVCYIAKNDDDFVRLIKIAVEENSPEKISARQKIAKENSWDKKVDKMVRVVEEHTYPISATTVGKIE